MGQERLDAWIRAGPEFRKSRYTAEGVRVVATTHSSSFGSLLRHYRVRAGLTQEALAQSAQLSVRGISDLEREINTRPRRFTLAQLADALELSPEERSEFEQLGRAQPRAHQVDAPSPFPCGQAAEVAGEIARLPEQTAKPVHSTGRPRSTVAGPAIAKDSDGHHRSAEEMEGALAGSIETIEPSRARPAFRGFAAAPAVTTGRRVRVGWIGISLAEVVMILTGGLVLDRAGAGGRQAGISAHLIASWRIPTGPVFSPTGIAVAPSGVVYAADRERDRILEFSPGGRVLTSWGTPGSGPGQLRNPHGLAVAWNGNVYVADTGNDRIEEFSPSGRFMASFGRRGTRRGELRSPQGVAVGTAGTTYVADTENSRVQAFTSAGTPDPYWNSVRTQRGKLFRPNDVAVFANGRLAVSDPPAGLMDILEHDGSFLWHAGMVPPPEFVTPTAVAVDDQGVGYILDSGLQSIRKYDPDGRVLRTWHGHFRSAQGLAVDRQGNLYVADTGNHRILKFASTGALLASWNGASNASASASSPEALARDARGDLYVADSRGNQVVVLSPAGHVVERWKGGGSAGLLNRPSGIAVDAQGRVFVADTGNDRIVRFSSLGTVKAAWSPTSEYPGAFNRPHGVRVDAHGYVYVADTLNHRVEELSSTGAYLQVWYVPVNPPKLALHDVPTFPPCRQGYECGRWSGMEIDSHGHVYVTDIQHNLVFKLSALGVVVAKWGGTGSLPGQLRSPEGIAVSRSGTVYVADTGNHRVDVFDRKGTDIGTIRDGLRAPSDVLVADGRGGGDMLYVTDSSSGRVWRFAVDV